jgi:pyridoxine 5-phosphate synthase
LKLGVNIDHVATLRQARGGREPAPARAARICQRSGADSIVMHLREDRRHIQDADLWAVREAVSLKINLEMSIAPSIVAIARGFGPDQVTLVPEKRMERTTEGGLDLFRKQKALGACLDRLRQKNIAISLFIDPDFKTLDEAKRLGVDAVEFHTGDYANAATPATVWRQYARLERVFARAASIGMKAHAGHGIDYQNVKLLKKIRTIDEFNIGYSIISRALWVGLQNAVKEMVRLVR